MCTTKRTQEVVEIKESSILKATFPATPAQARSNSRFTSEVERTRGDEGRKWLKEGGEAFSQIGDCSTIRTANDRRR
jgi:hypothetical protein